MRYFLTSLLFLLFFFSCRQEIDIVEINYTEDIPVELINTNIYGLVLDRDQTPLEGAKVIIRGREEKTDANGYYSFENIKANKNGTHVIANKNGYYQNIVTVYPSLNNALYKEILLREKTTSATFLSTSGGTVELENSTVLNIDPNSLVYESDGLNFNGQVYLDYAIHDISAVDFHNLLPGELVGIDVNNKLQGIKPYGLIQFSMNDGKLNALRLAKGQTAELIMPVPPISSGILEDTTPMWYMDKSINRWKQSGVAHLSADGRYYIGEIKNIEDWCFGSAFDIVEITGLITSVDGNSLVNHAIELSAVNDSDIYNYLSDNGGVFRGYMPKNKDLLFKVYNECGVLIHQESIGSFESDVSIEKELSDSELCRVLPIQGHLIDCDGHAINNAYVLIQSDENKSFFKTDESGKYIGFFKVCGETDKISMLAGNHEQNIFSNLHSDLGFDEYIKVGKWKLCDLNEGFVSLRFNNTYFFLNDDLRFQLSSGVVLFEADSEELGMDCLINDFQGVGVYEIKSETEAGFIVSFNSKSEIAPDLVPKDTASLSTYKLTVTKYTENELLEGTITGLARDKIHNDIMDMMYLTFSIPYKE